MMQSITKVFIIALTLPNAIPATEQASSDILNFKGLNNTKMVIEFSEEEKINISTLDVEEDQASSPEIFNGQSVVIEKSFGSRGFYIQITNVSDDHDQLTIEFMDYNGNLIDTYDYYWTSEADHSLLKANYVRGAKTVAIRRAGSANATKSAKVSLFEFQWLMTPLIIWGFISLCLVHILLTLFLMWRAGLLFGDSEDYDSASKFNIPTGGIRRKLLYLKFTILCILHNFDFVTDILYINTVPSYNQTIKVFMIMFMLPPLLVCLIGWFANEKEDREVKKLIFAVFGGVPLLSLYEDDYTDIRDLNDDAAVQGFIFVFEDGPQFALQTINSMLVGQSWSWIQVISPLLSIKGIAYKLLIKSNVKSRDLIIVTVCTNLLCLLPIVIFILAMFTYTDSRPEWAKQFNTVRYGLHQGQYPKVTDSFMQ